MMNKILKTIASAAILFSAQFAFSQTPGDTSIVQGFNFNSLVRDTQITFPVYDADKIERIWMKYTMRCKDGLISTSSNRNRGCGEWDRSEEHTSELQSRPHLVCRLLLEKKKHIRASSDRN